MEKAKVEEKIVGHINDLEWHISQTNNINTQIPLLQAKSTALLALAQIVGKE